MGKDYIGYEALTERALRSVVREALRKVETQGLVGSHQFYLTFKTEDPGVEVPDRLKERYPDEMTIVLQNQFWGLKVEETAFEVTLTFQKLPATLVVPFDAVTAFSDPGVHFGLQFRNATPRIAPAETGSPAKSAALPTMNEPKPKDPENQDAPEDGATDDDASVGSQVVSLDKFRKK